MERNKTVHRKKTVIVFFAVVFMGLGLMMRLVYLMVGQSEKYEGAALDLHQRERDIKAARGLIYDRNGIVLASNRTVCTISVIHSQITEPEKVIQMLSKELDMEEETIRKRVEKVSSIERIKSNVAKEIGDAIREYGLAGVKVDEDYKRYYPYDNLASKVLGFTGGDNQGIIGLEVKYDSFLQGEPGKILTITDSRGIELPGMAEERKEPVEGQNLITSLDVNMQLYATQAAEKVCEEKQADSVSIIIMNPQNGEIYTMVNVPEFNLNHPFELVGEEEDGLSNEQKQEKLNQMWRNPCLNDTYEPGSTFKIITASAALEEGVVSVADTFHCPGYRIVEDRRIRCHKTTGHGAETFVDGIKNSCKQMVIQLNRKAGRCSRL